jgi:uncharacterized glyoxalase superfamily protein PhnB
MATTTEELADTVLAMRPMVPAKDFATSQRFYTELGFQPAMLTQGLIEMKIGEFSFLLQDYYVPDWANNFAMHVRVSDVDRWWRHISSLDLESRYGAKTREPKQEHWGRVAIVIDPSGVIWHIAQTPAPGMP